MSALRLLGIAAVITTCLLALVYGAMLLWPGMYHA